MNSVAQSMQYHDVANLFPMMNDDEYAALVADIHQHGQRDPIWILDDRILDGRNRWQACNTLGVCPTTRQYDGPTDTPALVNFVVSLNLKRRHLSSTQKGFVALDIEKLLGEDAATRVGGRPRNGEKPSQMFDQVFECPNCHMSYRKSTGHICANNRRAAQQAADIIGTNRQYVSDAKRIASTAPDVAEQARNGMISMPEAKKLAALPEPDRATIIDRVTSGEVKNVNKALAELRNEAKRSIAMAQPLGTYNVIYADPPWEYDNTGVHGAANHHYPTMPLDGICSLLDDQKIAVADNAVLFLWATNPFLQDAFYVVNAWGFEYKTNMVWVKTDLVKPGSGFYVRGRHELLLICTRGSFTPLDPHTAPPIGSVISSPVQEHSAKPSEFYDTIERLYPGCNYLELFARQQRDGWEGWGYDSAGE